MTLVEIERRIGFQCNLLLPDVKTFVPPLLDQYPTTVVA